MLIGTIGESMMGEEEVWTLDKTSVIFYVRLSRMFSVESVMEAEQNLDPCLIKEQGTQDCALIPCQT
jgi:hypothetical protein